MPHRILQRLLARADHLLYSYPISVDLDRRDDPHALRLCDRRALVNVNLWFMDQKNIKRGEQAQTFGCMTVYRNRGSDDTLRKFAVG